MPAWPRYSHQQIILELARASGSLQLIAGQVADLEGEGKKISVEPAANIFTSAKPPRCFAAPRASAA